MTDSFGASSVASGTYAVDVTPPTGGAMTLSPASPVDASAALTVGFAGWTDPRVPLSYAVLIDG